jgi:polyisoprenoid-binding protein YceI
MNATPNLERSLRYLLAWAPAVEAAKTTLARRAVPDAALHAGTLGFEARTTFGQLLGATTSVTGSILGARDYTRVRGWVDAPVATLATGSRWADRALRAALDVERHPTMHFTLRGATVVSASLGGQDVTTLLFRGSLTLRGVTRRVELPATITRSAAISRVTSAFSINVADYGIERLTTLFGLARVQPRVLVRANLWFVDRLSESATP